MKHTVRISIADRSGNGCEVIRTKKLRLPMRLLRLLFGDFCEVMLLAPGRTVTGVEIHEQRQQNYKGGECNE